MDKNKIEKIDEEEIEKVAGGGHVKLTNKDFQNGKAIFTIPVGAKVEEDKDKK